MAPQSGSLMMAQLGFLRCLLSCWLRALTQKTNIHARSQPPPPPPRALSTMTVSRNSIMRTRTSTTRRSHTSRTSATLMASPTTIVRLINMPWMPRQRPHVSAWLIYVAQVSTQDASAQEIRCANMLAGRAVNILPITLVIFSTRTRLRALWLDGDTSSCRRLVASVRAVWACPQFQYAWCDVLDLRHVA